MARGSAAAALVSLPRNRERDSNIMIEIMITEGPVLAVSHSGGSPGVFLLSLYSVR